MGMMSTQLPSLTIVSVSVETDKLLFLPFMYRQMTCTLKNIYFSWRLELRVCKIVVASLRCTLYM